MRVLALLALVGIGTPAGAYEVYVTNHAFTLASVMPDGALPVEFEVGRSLKVTACRGEYEPATFVIDSEEPLVGIRVTCSDLRGKAGRLPSSCVDVRLAQMTARDVTRACMSIFPWTLVHDPDIFKIVYGTPELPIPAGLRARPSEGEHWAYMEVMKEAIDAKTMLPVDSDGREQYWLTVHVPEDARADTYKGRVTVTVEGDEKTRLTLTVRVPDIDLIDAPFTYSMYYPKRLEGAMSADAPKASEMLTEAQMLSDFRNMVAHGLTNPNTYDGARVLPKGTPDLETGIMDFELLGRILDLREQAGMPKGRLYTMDGGMTIVYNRPLTHDEQGLNKARALTINAWAMDRGYTSVLWMGMDEAPINILMGERESFQSCRTPNGGGIWVACNHDWSPAVGDALRTAVIMDPGYGYGTCLDHARTDADEWLRNPYSRSRCDARVWITDGGEYQDDPRFQKGITASHAVGNEVLSYMDPPGNWPDPESHRRNRGFGLYVRGTDGTMTWAFCGFDPPLKVGGPVDSGIVNGFLSCRGPEAMFDTIAWEGFREGVDDARYVATLSALDGGEWLESKHINELCERNLDDLRAEVVERIEALNG